MKFTVYAFLLLPIILCTQCIFENFTYKSIREIRYHYRDASVPPEYHRSYVIVLNRDSVRIIVDSYKDILMDVTYKSTSEKFGDILLSIEKNKIRKCMLTFFSHPCTGGHTESVEFWNGNSEIFSGSVYYCASKNYGNICGNIADFFGDIKSLVPLQEILEKHANVKIRNFTNGCSRP